MPKALGADAAKHGHLGVGDLPVGEDHAEEQKELGRQHGIVGDLAHAGITLENFPDLGKQSPGHRHPRFVALVRHGLS